MKFLYEYYTNTYKNFNRLCILSINIFLKMFTIDHDREKNHSNLDIFKSILTPMIIIWIYIKYKYIMMIND